MVLTLGLMKKMKRKYLIAYLDTNYCSQWNKDMSYFAYACKTEGKNGISRLISGLCLNCLSSIPEYSRLNHLDVYLV